jgi:hypothetical protein
MIVSILAAGKALATSHRHIGCSLGMVELAMNDKFSAVSHRSKGLFPRVSVPTDARQANASRV